MKTQNEMVLDHLQSGKPLTPLTALQRYGVFRLAARVCDLRSMGHEIETIKPAGVHFAVYKMLDKSVNL